MSDPGGMEERQRIAELEQEVARLRGELADRGGDAGAEEAGDDAGDEDRVALPSRSRAIIIAVTLALVALIGIVSIMLGLSNVIQPLSQQAAESISPWEPGDDDEDADEDQRQRREPAERRSRQRPATDEPELRAPGF